MDNQYTYKIATGKAKGDFNIYQARNGKVFLAMGSCATELSIVQIQQLNIDIYSLIDFSHEDFDKAYPNNVYTRRPIPEALYLLKQKGYTPVTDLNYCTDNGVEYYIGWRGKEAAIVALMHDEKNLYFITKEELREMSLTAKTYGIEKVTLFTNYGCELHSTLEKPTTVGLNKIIKHHGNIQPHSKG